MSEKIAVGSIELANMALGYQVEDVMLKTSSIKIDLARPILPGKFLIVISGKIADVEAAIAAGREFGGDQVLDWLTVASVCLAIFPALDGTPEAPTGQVGGLGIVETLTGVSSFIAADYAGKAANVTLYRIDVDRATGGKGLLLLYGPLSDVKVAVAAAENALKDGFCTASAVIPNPSPELFAAYAR